jgi:hypothetical protein
VISAGHSTRNDFQEPRVVRNRSEPVIDSHYFTLFTGDRSPQTHEQDSNLFIVEVCVFCGWTCNNFVVIDELIGFFYYGLGSTQTSIRVFRPCD